MVEWFFLPKGDRHQNTNMKTYNIIRHYFKRSDYTNVAHPYMGYIPVPAGYRRLIKRGLTLKEARAHCNDPETSSSTCTKSYPKSLTRKHGPWFDGYTEA